MQTVLNVEGMSCKNCVKHVSEALSELAGVESVAVSLESGTATVEHDGGVSLDVLTNAVEDAGYDVV